MNWELWLQAFLLTHAIEILVWLIASRRLSVPRRYLVVFGPSCITHPVVWFVFPWDTWPYLPTLVLAEAFAVAIEALYVRRLGIVRPWRWSLAANAASLGGGLGVLELLARFAV